MRIEIDASVALSKLIHDAVLEFGDSDYELDRLAPAGSDKTSGLLYFSLQAKGEKKVKPADMKTVTLYLQFNAVANSYPSNQTVRLAMSKLALHKSEIVAATTDTPLADDRISGTARSGKHTLRTSGVYARLVDTSAQWDSYGTASYQIKLELTAFDTNAYIRKQTHRWGQTVSNVAHGGVAYAVENNKSKIVAYGTDKSTLTASTLLWRSGGLSAYYIQEGESATATLTVKYSLDGKGPDGLYRVRADALQWAKTQSSAESGQWQSLSLADTTTTDMVGLP
jgi:hypothetical protein